MHADFGLHGQRASAQTPPGRVLTPAALRLSLNLLAGVCFSLHTIPKESPLAVKGGFNSEEKCS